MVSTGSTTQALMEVVKALESLDSIERMKCVRAALVLLGEDEQPVSGKVHRQDSSLSGQSEVGDNRTTSTQLGEQAHRWMVKHKVTEDQLHQVFHIDGKSIEIIADDVPGNSRREQTVNCYLLVGIRNLLQNDEARFQDKEALEYCQITHAYDRNNHTTHRQSLSNRVSGDRKQGFALTVPGLRDAAKIVKQMCSEDEQ